MTTPTRPEEATADLITTLAVTPAQNAPRQYPASIHAKISKRSFSSFICQFERQLRKHKPVITTLALEPSETRVQKTTWGTKRSRATWNPFRRPAPHAKHLLSRPFALIDFHQGWYFAISSSIYLHPRRLISCLTSRPSRSSPSRV